VSGDAGAGASGEEWAALARVAAGDLDAFAPLVARHQDRVVRLCARILGDRDEALDVAQETFLRAYRHAADAEPRGALSTWLHRIAVNLCLNRLRRRRLVRFLSLTPEPEAERAGPEVAEPASAAADPERELLARERWRRTREAIDALPAGQRAVLVLARFEGMSGREIAETLGISEGAVESRLVRAMRRLAAAQGAEARRVPGRRRG
jgi:RNA polymerase sigma-70 factor (ECF subfamily)